MVKQNYLKMTPLRLDLLRLAATQGEQGPGIPAWLYHYFKPHSKRTVNAMFKAGWLTRNAYLDIVVTDEGRKVYEGWSEED